MAAPLKALVVGPSRSHKTPIVNFLSGLTDSIVTSASSPVLKPTVGVRITEIAPSPAYASSLPSGIELWDTSGDQAFEATWPAICIDTAGIVLVYDPSQAGAQQEIELWHEWFVVKNDIPFDRVVCWAVTADGAPRAKALPALGPIPVESHSIDDQDNIKRSFEKYIGRLLNSLRNSKK